MSEGPTAPSVITVVIPTFNHLPTLRICLEHLEAQTLTNFDVIVINDGSTDGTKAALTEIQQRSPFRLQVLHQQNAGPARARNVAIAHVTTDLCLLIGDDTLATPTVVESHLQFHCVNPDTKKAVIGWTQWDPVHQKITPFMQWYEKIQFDYEHLTAGRPVIWKHFYTSNLSFKTRLIRENPFDERFKSAVWEDIELAYRLTMNNNLQLTFLPNAVATHLHPTTFRQAIRRMRTVGRSERLFYETWPVARPSSHDRKMKICNLPGERPSLLHAVTFAVERLPRLVKPGKLHAMLLRSHRHYGYIESNP
ncbi:glycosyltransferase family 2 protein [Granulicella sp. L60]|uniref:glycosyltransferase family 2 protein n=1 Tax=Granulicella sp. L60 TaxID=1641866 RepID=UPI00131DF7EE|nr:glycosyltransferase family A protein [Granulicella sp. L60]